MLPVKTPSSNHNFGPPAEVTDGSIGDLPCQIVDERGYREIVSVWKPSLAERAAIAAGQNVRLGVVWIGGFPPVSLGVTHEAAEDSTALTATIEVDANDSEEEFAKKLKTRLALAEDRLIRAFRERTAA